MQRRKDTIPALGKTILWLFLNDEDYHQISGDFEESYRYRVKTQGRARAVLWFWLLLFKSLPGFVGDSLYWRGAMIKNYLKISLRVIIKQKLFSFLNIAGLAVSLTCGFLIILHVKDELGYETCFSKADRLYRVQINSKYGSNFRNWAASAPALGPMLEDSFPEIERTARLTPLRREILGYVSPDGVKKNFEETNGFFADPSVIPMFDLDFLSGAPQTALKEPNAAVLTSTLAAKYFSGEYPIGKILTIEGEEEPLKVTGVIRDLPKNTHLKIDYLVSMPTFVTYVGWGPAVLNHRTWKAMYTYVLLEPRQSAAGFDARSAEFMKDFLSEKPGRLEELRLQPIRRIHLHSKLEGEIGANSDIAYVYIFSGTALLLLLIAAVNFINLSTAQSFKRMKEIGIRKVIGARKGQVIRQYLGESFLLTILAAGLTLILLKLILPFYQRISGKNILFKDVFQAENVLFLLLLIGFLALLAGFYPAFFASRFQPVTSLKSVKDPRSSASRLRKGLVVFQFVISVFMIFCTLTIYRQLEFFHNQDLGFEKDDLIALRLYGDVQENIVQNLEALKVEFLRNPGVIDVALTSGLPGIPFSNERLTPVSVEDKNTLPMLRFIRVDENFIDVLGLEIIQGRNFDRVSDQTSAYIISESVVAALDLQQPLGVECRSDIHEGTAPIVGVIKDFHFASLHNPIEPLVLEYRPSWTGYMLVKIQSGSLSGGLQYLRQKFQEIAPDHLFSYIFVDDVFNRNYENEDRGYNLFRVFSLIALFVACLGLFGLTVFAAETRVKEIGIRKVLGASAASISLLLSREFILWVLLSNLVAWPAAYWVMNQWLENFAFRVNLQIWTFLISGALVIIFALATVSFKAVKTAVANPVDSLRYE